MKKLFSIALFMAIFGFTYGQKCKEVVDPISNEKAYEFVDDNPWHGLKYERKGGKTTLTKQFNYTGALNIIAPAGSEVFFKLENGEIVKLLTNGETAGKMFTYGAIYTGYNYAFNLTKEDMAKLAASPVILIRIPKLTETGFYDLDKKNVVVKKGNKAIMKGAACMNMY